MISQDEMKMPVHSEEEAKGDQEAKGATATFAVVAREADRPEATFTGSFGSLCYGSVQAWYVRAVEGAPRLTSKGEQLVRERLRRTQYDMSVALGTSLAAVDALIAGFEKVRG